MNTAPDALPEPRRDLDVVVVCEINVDVVVAGITGPPRFGAEQLAREVLLTAGSSGVLTATGLAALGLRVGICGMVGDDAFGHFMLEHCTHHGIDVEGVVVDPRERTGASVLLSMHGDRAILTHPGAMARFSHDRVRLDTLARARHLHLSSYFLQAALRPDIPSLLARARGLGLSVSADTGHDPDERWRVEGLLEGLDLFLPNEVEALAITGAHTIEHALECLAASVPLAVVKCGGDGARAARGVERIHAQGFRVEVADTSGAGDAFDAGFLARWLAGDPLATCARYGNACGALTAAHMGGTGAVDRERVAILIAQQAG